MVLICRNLSLLHLRIVCAKFGWNWSSGSGKVRQCIFAISWLSEAFYLNKLEFHSPKDALCQVWLKLAKQLWRRNFLIFDNVLLLFRNYLPLFEQTWISFTSGCFVPSWKVEMSPVVLEKNKILLMYFGYFIIISP